MVEIDIDFETRSAADIEDSGSHVYAAHPSTRVFCLAYQIGEAAPRLWAPKDFEALVPSEPPPLDLFEAIKAGGLLWAHNTSFEIEVWQEVCSNRWGWPEVPLESWRCSASLCSSYALPRSLAPAGAVQKLDLQKDKEGNKIMLEICRPTNRKAVAEKGAAPLWDTSPEKVRRVGEYCLQDIAAQRTLRRSLPPLSPGAVRLWLLDQKVNLRGIPIDIPAMEDAIAIVQEEEEKSLLRLPELTGGKVKSHGQIAEIVKWVGERGTKIPNLKGDTVTKALQGPGLNSEVRELLTIRSNLANSSTSKLNAMRMRSGGRGRVRWGHVYHGASTGRWTGKGMQPHNFPRGTFGDYAKDAVEVVHSFLPSRYGGALDTLLGPPLEVIASSLRSFIKAEEGKVFRVSDFASIEARVLAWLAGEAPLIEAFEKGVEIYCDMASDIYEREISKADKDERQMGKTAILGLGYGMGPGSRHSSGFVGAVAQMAKKTISRKFARKVVKAYRAKYPKIPQFWRDLQSAAILAIQNPSETFKAGEFLELSMGSGFEETNWKELGDETRREALKKAKDSTRFLRVKLPSGRFLHYSNPDLKEVLAPWSEGSVGSFKAPETDRDYLEEILDIRLGPYEKGAFTGCDIPKGVGRALRDRYGFRSLNITAKESQKILQILFWGVHPKTKKWSQLSTYGGKLCENIVQGVARDFLAEAMLRTDLAGYNLIFHVHDEIVSEDPEDFGSLAEFERIMAQRPAWGAGCPIGVEGYASKRYRK